MTASAILTAAGMRAAEDRAIAAGASVDMLMDRAGGAVAKAAWYFTGGMETLILCGPGNNGGDGYVIARYLRDHGVHVRVAALADPQTPAAISARAAWGDDVGTLVEAEPAPLLIDALFGTGLSRGLAGDVADTLRQLADAARIRIAVDLPSGIATDDGRLLSPVPVYDMTVALGALKPAHLLQPAARHMGRLVIADIGLEPIASALVRIERPSIKAPGPESHKYSRGMVVVIAGAMPGAALLAAGAAQRAGAGYVVLGGSGADGPASLVHRARDAALGDARAGGVVIGPGLGRDTAAQTLLDAVLGSGRALVIDADALTLLGEAGIARIKALGTPAILTPHEGEFAHMFGDLPGSKIDRARAAAARSGAVVLLKGSDSVVAHPDGRAAIAPAAPVWLASAGSGDVLAGIVAAMMAQGRDPFAAAQAALWLHAEAARRAGPMLIADDLVVQVAAAAASCL